MWKADKERLLARRTSSPRLKDECQLVEQILLLEKKARAAGTTALGSAQPVQKAHRRLEPGYPPCSSFSGRS